ncbi:MAG: hypothetical protein ISR77_16695 [Pirellulaceae bacterium]|nr:hypothetical protein [Pirellulaceae bacterium]
MQELEDLRTALTTTAADCRVGHYDQSPGVTLGDTLLDIGGRKTGRRKYWLRDLLRSVAAVADGVGLDPETPSEQQACRRSNAAFCR